MSVPLRLCEARLRRRSFGSVKATYDTLPKLDSDLLVGEVVPFLLTWEQHYSDPTALSGVDQ